MTRQYGAYFVTYFATNEIREIIKIRGLKVIIDDNSMFFADEKEALLTRLTGATT